MKTKVRRNASMSLRQSSLCSRMRYLMAQHGINRLTSLNFCFRTYGWKSNVPIMSWFEMLRRKQAILSLVWFFHKSSRVKALFSGQTVIGIVSTRSVSGLQTNSSTVMRFWQEMVFVELLACWSRLRSRPENMSEQRYMRMGRKIRSERRLLWAFIGSIVEEAK